MSVKKLRIQPPRETTFYFMEQVMPCFYEMKVVEDATVGGMFFETHYKLISTETGWSAFYINRQTYVDKIIATTPSSLPFPPMVGWIAEKDTCIKDFLLSLRTIYQYDGGNNI